MYIGDGRNDNSFRYWFLFLQVYRNNVQESVDGDGYGVGSNSTTTPPKGRVELIKDIISVRREDIQKLILELQPSIKSVEGVNNGVDNKNNENNSNNNENNSNNNNNNNNNENNRNNNNENNSNNNNEKNENNNSNNSSDNKINVSIQAMDDKARENENLRKELDEAKQDNVVLVNELEEMKKHNWLLEEKLKRSETRVQEDEERNRKVAESYQALCRFIKGFDGHIAPLMKQVDMHLYTQQLVPPFVNVHDSIV